MTADQCRKQIKDLFLTILMLGDYIHRNDNIPVTFLSNLQIEMKTNARALLRIPEYAQLHTLAKLQTPKKRKGKQTNPLATMLSYICQQEESKIMHAKTVFTERFRRVATNLFDGHLREKGPFDLAACSRFIEDQTGHT